MRKIEKQMIEAIRSGKNWSHANTAVRIASDYLISDAGADHYRGTFAIVLLHGHAVAYVTHVPATGCMVATPDADTFRAWPTATTRSRLRALGINASIKNGRAMLDGMPA